MKKNMENKKEKGGEKNMPRELNGVEAKIIDLRNEIMSKGQTGENGRIKAIINTKLQEAELFASVLYETEETTKPQTK